MVVWWEGKGRKKGRACRQVAGRKVAWCGGQAGVCGKQCVVVAGREEGGRWWEGGVYGVCRGRGSTKSNKNRRRHKNR